MKSQTSLVASQVRLQHWAEQIKDCQNRPEDMDVKTWCDQNGLTKANYYYRVRKVREACLSVCEDPIELYNTASQELIQKILGACAYAQ